MTPPGAYRIVRGSKDLGSSLTLFPDDESRQYLRAVTPSGMIILAPAAGGVRLTFFEAGTWTYAWDDGPEQTIEVVKPKPREQATQATEFSISSPMTVLRRPRF